MPFYRVKAYFTTETVAVIEADSPEAAENLDGDISVQMDFGPYLDEVEVLEEFDGEDDV